MKPCFDLFTDKPQTQTNTRNMSGTWFVRKKDKSGKINKFVVFWQTHMS